MEGVVLKTIPEYMPDHPTIEKGAGVPEGFPKTFFSCTEVSVIKFSLKDFQSR